jgi:hypothetical protein
LCVCVCLLLQDLVQSCLRGEGGIWRTCATRDDEPRPVWTVWTSLPTTHLVNSGFLCVYYGVSCIVCVFYYCRTYCKAVRVGGGGEWRTCAMRDDEPRSVWMSLLITHCIECKINL